MGRPKEALAASATCRCRIRSSSSIPESRTKPTYLHFQKSFNSDDQSNASPFRKRLNCGSQWSAFLLKTSPVTARSTQLDRTFFALLIGKKTEALE